jgi:hypothetical protein
MALNIIRFLFIAVLWGLLYAFPLRCATTRADFKPGRYFLLAFGVFFVGNALRTVLSARTWGGGRRRAGSDVAAGIRGCSGGRTGALRR